MDVCDFVWLHRLSNIICFQSSKVLRSNNQCLLGFPLRYELGELVTDGVIAIELAEKLVTIYPCTFDQFLSDSCHVGLLSFKSALIGAWIKDSCLAEFGNNHVGFVNQENLFRFFIKSEFQFHSFKTLIFVLGLYQERRLGLPKLPEESLLRHSFLQLDLLMDRYLFASDLLYVGIVHFLRSSAHHPQHLDLISLWVLDRPFFSPNQVLPLSSGVCLVIW